MDIYYEHNEEIKKATLNLTINKPKDFVFLGGIPEDKILGSAILAGELDGLTTNYTLEGISSSGFMSSIEPHDILEYTVLKNDNFKVEDLSLGPNWSSIKIVPNPNERGPLESPDVFEYLGDKSITACANLYGEEFIQDGGVFQDFDFALIRYIWNSQGGKDLDTRTYITDPDRKENMVGWNRMNSDANYLLWNNDNTGSGVEGVLVNLKELKKDFPGQKEFKILLRAFWYNTRASGDLTVEVTTYKGGTMSRYGYDWVNTGGTLVQNVKLKTNSPMQISLPEAEGTPLAVLYYNTETNLGSLSPNVEEEVINPPEEVYPIPETDTFEFKLLNPEIRLFFPGHVEDWYLEDEDGVFIHPRKSNTDYLSSDTSGGETYIRVSNEDNRNKNYKLWISDTPYLRTSVVVERNQPITSSMVVTKFTPNTSNYEFNLKDTNLIVPEILPEHITEIRFSYSEVFNQDISNWDVSNLTNMDYMFRYAQEFNQDLSSWNVERFSTKPHEFDEGATSWVAPKPIWGGANFTNVDLTGQSGVYITLSKNNGDWITYNLSDPDFNQNEFLKFVSYNESNTALAFKGYSENNNEVLTAICGFTKDGFARTPVSSTDTIGRLYLDDKQTVDPQILNIESTELIAKPTEGIPRQYDLYYSLTGADATETVVIKSAASVKLEDFVLSPTLGVIPTDYILRYDFNGNITDLSSNNYQSIQSGAMTFVAGRKTGTQALEFENGKIVTDALSINSTQLTVTCWLKGSQVTTGGVFRLGNGSNGFHFFYNNTTSNYNLSDVAVNGAETRTSLNRMSYNNTWTFITLILDRLAEEESVVIKVNNGEKGYSTYERDVNNYANSSLTIGKYDTRFPFVGSIQDVRIYNRILTSEEQTQLFNE